MYLSDLTRTVRTFADQGMSGQDILRRFADAGIPDADARHACAVVAFERGVDVTFVDLVLPLAAVKGAR